MKSSILQGVDTWTQTETSETKEIAIDTQCLFKKTDSGAQTEKPKSKRCQLMPV